MCAQQFNPGDVVQNMLSSKPRLIPGHPRIVQAVIRHSTERAPRGGHLDLYSSIPSVEGHDLALIYHGALI